ncbi:MAG: BACON domain-containing protein [Alistipes sp.]|nr:BACON domain-containing protein [Alistipes sp.]
MKRFTKLYSLLAVALLALTACDKPAPEPAPEGEASVITLATESLSVKAEGGDYTVRYSIANPIEGEALSFDYDAEWLRSIAAEAGNIKISIDANEGEERTAEVVIGYKSAESITLSVKQEAATPATPEEISIVIEELTGTNCITVVTPADPEMYYVMYKSDIQYFYDSAITNDDELFEDDMFYFKRGADYDGISLKEYMANNQVLFQNVTRANWPDLRPANRQVLYVYGVEFNEDFTDCTRITEVVWKLIDPPMAELGDATFDVTYKVDGPNVEFDVKPQGWDGLYTIQIFDYNEELYRTASEVDDDYVRQVGKGWITMFGNNLDGGLSVENILDFACLTGAQQRSYELASYTLYTAVVYAVAEVDGFYQMVSRPKVINFSTEKVEPSDMTIDITVDNLYVRVCDLKITPSSNNEPYKMLLLPTEYLDRDYTDDILIESVLDTYSYAAYTFRDEVESHISSLYPSTEYIVVTFGYSGGVVTTPVFKRVFTTEAEGKCELAITDVEYGGPYKPSELKALDPKRFSNIPDGYDDYMFVVWMEVKTDTPTSDIFTYFVDTETYKFYGEDVIFFDLLISTCDPVSTALAQYDFNYYICAAAFDYKGNVTPMWRSDAINFQPDDCRPAEELIEKLNSSTRAQAMVVDRHSGKVVAVR